jgi:hypothetical protein
VCGLKNKQFKKIDQLAASLAQQMDSSFDSPSEARRLSMGSIPPIERLSIPAALTESSEGKTHTVYVIEVHSNGSTWQVKCFFLDVQLREL